MKTIAIFVVGLVSSWNAYASPLIPTNDKCALVVKDIRNPNDNIAVILLGNKTLNFKLNLSSEFRYETIERYKLKESTLDSRITNVYEHTEKYRKQDLTTSIQLTRLIATNVTTDNSGRVRAEPAKIFDGESALVTLHVSKELTSAGEPFKKEGLSYTIKCKIVEL